MFESGGCLPEIHTAGQAMEVLKTLTVDAPRELINHFLRRCDHLMRLRPTETDHAKLLYCFAHGLSLLEGTEMQVASYAATASIMARKH